MGNLSTKRRAVPPPERHKKPLENSKYEAFAHAIVRGVTLTDAAIEAGFAPGSSAVTGSRLMKKPEILARIGCLREMHGLTRAPANVDRQWVLNSLVRNVENALAANDRGAANRGLELLGREYGLFTERRIEMNSPFEGLTADQLVGLLAAADRLEGQVIDVSPTPAEHIDNQEPSKISGLQEQLGYIVPNDLGTVDLAPAEDDLGLGSADTPHPAEPAGAGGAGAGPGLDTPPSPPPAEAPQGHLNFGDGPSPESGAQQ